MTIFIPAGRKKTNTYILNSSQFSLSGTELSITPSGVYTFATNTQAITGTSEELMINPANLTAVLNNYISGLSTYPVILDSNATSVTCGNTADETTLYSFSIPADTLGTDNALRLTIYGTWLQDSFRDLAVNLKYGSTTVATIAGADITASSTTTGFEIRALLAGQGATNSQYGQVALIPGVKEDDNSPWSAQGTASEDSTGALDFVVTVAWSGTSADSTLTTKYSILEKIIGV